MAIDRFLAMTAGEIRNAPSLPQPIGWMACHFSPYGTGLTDLPPPLPNGSLLILDDSIPPSRHDPELICDQLRQLIDRGSFDGLLLDLQRPHDPSTAQIARMIVQTLPCPVAVTPDYASDLSCPVFLPPIPPHIPPEDHLSPWIGRPIWLELALEGSRLTVTESGCRYTPIPFPEDLPYPHDAPQLSSHYRIDLTPEAVMFTFVRTSEDLMALTERSQSLGISRMIGLYQQLHHLL